MAHATWDLGRESYWRTMLARWRRSGLKVREFCRSEGISEPTFYGWRRRLAQSEETRPAFLPVQVVSESVEPPLTRGIEVVLANGRCLRVAPGFDPNTLTQLVALLEGGRGSC